MTTQCNTIFLEYCSLFWMTLSSWKMLHDIIESQTESSNKDIPHLVAITVPADILAPCGARTSAGTVMTKFRTCVYCVQYTGPYLPWMWISIPLRFEMSRTDKIKFTFIFLRNDSASNGLKRGLPTGYESPTLTSSEVVRDVRVLIQGFYMLEWWETTALVKLVKEGL